jgi:hypothetical protein
VERQRRRAILITRTDGIRRLGPEAVAARARWPAWTPAGIPEARRRQGYASGLGCLSPARLGLLCIDAQCRHRRLGAPVLNWWRSGGSRWSSSRASSMSRGSSAGSRPRTRSAGRSCGRLRKLQREPRLALRVLLGAPGTTHHLGHRQARGASRPGGEDRLPGPSAHAPPRDRRQARERRPGHAGDPGLPRPCEHHAHGAVYGVGPGAVQGLLPRLNSTNAGRREK